MKRVFSVVVVLSFAAAAFGQNETVRRETTTVTTTTTTLAKSSSPDLLGLETFNFLDATTLTDGALDLRIAGRWVEGNDNVDTFGTFEDDDAGDDQIILTPELVWGATDRLELFLSVPFWVDGEPREGNYDS